MLCPGLVASATIGTVIITMDTLLKSFYGVILAAAGISFAWGLVSFILKPKGGKDGSKHMDVMVWSITALFLMFSVWGNN